MQISMFDPEGTELGSTSVWTDPDGWSYAYMLMGDMAGLVGGGFVVLPELGSTYLGGAGYAPYLYFYDNSLQLINKVDITSLQITIYFMVGLSNGGFVGMGNTTGDEYLSHLFFFDAAGSLISQQDIRGDIAELATINFMNFALSSTDDGGVIVSLISGKKVWTYHSPGVEVDLSGSGLNSIAGIGGSYFQAAQVAPPGCTDDSDCNDGKYCDVDSGQCVECLAHEHCPIGYRCVSGVCIEDNPPSLTSGPFLAAGSWPLLTASQESPTYLDANYEVLWTFSDDYASCPSGACTHVAEYQEVGGNWTPLDVTANAANGYAYVELPVESLQNATTYAFRYSVTDCASQTTQSQTYYFRVAFTDAPPVITSGPFVAGGTWPALATSSARATVLEGNVNVLWKFSDDYASCAGLCTHRARYRKVGDTAWTWITVSADPTGKQYAYTELPVAGLGTGTYQFFFDVLDCAGQLTKAPKVYYFKVE